MLSPISIVSVVYSRLTAPVCACSDVCVLVCFFMSAEESRAINVDRVSRRVPYLSARNIAPHLGSHSPFAFLVPLLVFLILPSRFSMCLALVH